MATGTGALVGGSTLLATQGAQGTRVISASMLSTLYAQMSKPGYLVEILWPPDSDGDKNEVRLSSRGDTEWNGRVWVASALQISGLTWDGSGDMRGNISILTGATKTVFDVVTSLSLNLGTSDIPVRVWLFDKGALGATDPLLVVDGYGDSCQVDPSRLVFQFVSKRARTQFSPRKYICAERGFNYVPQTGKRIFWGGQHYVLNRAR